MIRGFYTAKSGLAAHQEHMNTISNNIANVNTNGFKSMRTAFKDLVYRNTNRPDAPDSAMTGHGVRINKNDVLMHSGSLEATGRALDVAITDENGFFAVEDVFTGEIKYTRAGNFYLSNQGDDTFHLVNSNGDRVLDMDMEYIEFADDDEDFVFDAEIVGVFRFGNPYALLNTESTCFLETVESGGPEPIEYPNIKAAYLEGSNVDIAEQMTHVIESSKAFSFSAKMIQTADEIEQTVNNLR